MLGKEQQNHTQSTSQAPQGPAADSSAHEKTSSATEVTKKEIEPSIGKIDPQSLGVVESSANITELEKIFFNLFDILILCSIEPQEFQKVLNDIEKLFSISIEGHYTNEELIKLYCRLLELTFRQFISFDDFTLPLPHYIYVRINFQLVLLESLINISHRLLKHLIQHKDENHYQHCRKVFAWLDWLLRSVAKQVVHLLYSYCNTEKLSKYGLLSVQTFNTYKQRLVEELAKESKDDVFIFQLDALDAVILSCHILLFNEFEVLCSISNQVFPKEFKQAQQKKITDFLKSKKTLIDKDAKFEFIFSEEAIQSLNAYKLHNFSKLLAVKNNAYLIDVLNKEFGFSIVFAEFHNVMEDELKIVKEKIIKTQAELKKSRFFNGWYEAASAANGNHFDMAAGKFFDQLVNAYNTLAGSHLSKIPGTVFKAISFSHFYNFQLLFLYLSLFICYALLSGVENLNKAMEKLYQQFMKTYAIMSTKCRVRVTFGGEMKEQLKAREEVEKVVKLMRILYDKSKAVLEEKTIQDKKRYAIEEKEKMLEEQKGKKAQNKKKKKKNRKKKEKPEPEPEPEPESEKAEDDLTDSSDIESETHSSAAAEQEDERNCVAMTKLEAAEKKLDEACSAIFQIQKVQVFTSSELVQMKQCCEEVRLIVESLSPSILRENQPLLEKKTSLQHTVDTILDLITIAANKNIEKLFSGFDINKTEESSKLLLQVVEACQLVSMDKQGSYLGRVDRLQAELDLRIQEEKRRVQEQEELMRQKCEEEKRVKREAEERRQKEELEEQKKEADRLKREAEEKQRQEAAEKLKREAEEKQRQEAAEKLKRDEEERVRREAEERRQKEELEKQQKEADRLKAEVEEKQRQEEERKIQMQSEVIKSLKAFFDAFPACRQFIVSNELCLTGGAILDIYYVWKIFSTELERKVLWSKLIADLDCIAPQHVTLELLLKLQKLNGAKIIYSSGGSCPPVLKGQIENLEFDIHVGAFVAHSHNDPSQDLVVTDLTTSAIGLRLVGDEKDPKFVLYDPTNGVEDLLYRHIRLIGSAHDKIMSQPARLFRLIRLIGKFVTYQMYEMELSFDQVFASPGYMLNPDMDHVLASLNSVALTDDKKVSLTPAHLVQLMFKSFLNGHAFTHFRVGVYYNIFNIFFNTVKFSCNLDFLANLFCQMDLQDLMWAIDQTEDKQQKIILFLYGVLRFFLQSHDSHDFKGVIAFINCAVGIATTMPEVNKGSDPTIARTDLISALYNLLIQDVDLTDRAKLLFAQGFYYPPPAITQYLSWKMFPPGQASQPVVVGGTTYFPPTNGV